IVCFTREGRSISTGATGFRKLLRSPAARTETRSGPRQVTGGPGPAGLTEYNGDKIGRITPSGAITKAERPAACRVNLPPVRMWTELEEPRCATGVSTTHRAEGAAHDALEGPPVEVFGRRPREPDIHPPRIAGGKVSDSRSGW